MTGAAGLAIRTEDLRKTYKSSRGDVPAVRGIDLSVGSGQFFGLLGPNGAGKSTTIGMLTTLVLPTGGRAWVAGLDVVANPVGVKRRIGVVTQNNTLDMQLTVAENLEFRSRFFGLGLREASRRASQLLEVFGLADRRKAMSTDLSGGQAKRLLIARALVHRPDVLFLDEPTAGLDPQTRANLWDILRVLHAEGQTILLTTHYMEEAEALCEQVAVVDHGEVLASGTVNELKEGDGRGDRDHGQIRGSRARWHDRTGRAGRTPWRQQGGNRRRLHPGLHPRARGRARRAGDRGFGGRTDRARRDPAQAQPGDRVPYPDRTGVPRVTTTQTAPPVAADHPGVPSASEVAALIAEAPEPRPTLVRTFNAMMAREFRVLRRNAIATFTRAVMQPLLFVFVFAYVFPKIGGGFNLGGGASSRPGCGQRSTSRPSWCPA